MKLPWIFSLIFFTGLWGLLPGCSTVSRPPITQIDTAVFHLLVDRPSIARNGARVEISVPGRVTSFIAPPHYGGGPPLIQYVSNLKAVDSRGTSLAVTQDKNIVKIKSGSSRPYTLSYTLSVPQKVSGEIYAALPTLDEKHGRFDNNNTFLNPEGIADLPARIVISAPDQWVVATGWGVAREALVAKVSQLISGTRY